MRRLLSVLSMSVVGMAVLAGCTGTPPTHRGGDAAPAGRSAGGSAGASPSSTRESADAAQENADSGHSTGSRNASGQSDAQGTVLTHEGYGNLTIGMSLTQARESGGLLANGCSSPESDRYPRGFRMCKLQDLPRAGSACFSPDHGLAAIMVSTTDQPVSVRTTEGIRIGSTWGRVKTAYPDGEVFGVHGGEMTAHLDAGSDQLDYYFSASGEKKVVFMALTNNYARCGNL